MTANVAFLGKRHVTNSNKPVKTFALTHWTLANCCRAFDIDEQYMNYDIQATLPVKKSTGKFFGKLLC